MRSLKNPDKKKLLFGIKRYSLSLLYFRRKIRKFSDN